MFGFLDYYQAQSTRILEDNLWESSANHNFQPSTQQLFCCTLYRVSQEECARLREGVPYVKVYRYNPKHLYPKLNGYGDNGQRNLKV
jgi:hypothetical protein